MADLYITNKNYSSWSLRPWVLMRELNIPFTERLVPIDSTSGADPFRRFSPTGKVPCLIDGSIVIWDSLGITEYLAEQTPRVWPADRLARAWARCAVAEMHSGFQALRNRCTMSCGLRVRIDSNFPGLKQDLVRLDELWSEGFSRFGGPFLAGRLFTAVDAFFAPVAFRVQTYGLVMAPASHAYIDRLLALPSMQEWYASALSEPWRDEAHEEEARNAGAWLHDYRAAG